MSIVKHLNANVAGITPYQPGRPIEEVARELNIDPATICKLASNECPLGPSPKALTAMKKAAEEMHFYPDGGAYYLRQKLSKKLKVKPEQLIFGNGSNEILEFIGHCLLKPGTSAVMSAYAFVIYKLITKMCGAEVIEVPMKGLTHDLEAMANAIRPDTRVVFICNPNNPTSSMVTEQEINDFMNKVPEDVLVVFDEAYVEIALGAVPDTMKFVKDGRDVILLHTFSKAYGLAGLRIGYGVSTPEIIQALEKPRQPFNVNRMAQIAAGAALDDQDFVDKGKALYLKGAEMIGDFCEDHGLEYEPPNANFILIKVGNGQEIFEKLQKMGVIVRPMGGYMLPEWIRISLGTEAENEKFIACMEKILNER
jgi:histidinol-phosphate aminotransferase